MTIQFSTSSQEARVSGVKVAVYGGSGMGKTALTATLPRPVLISAESGLLSLAPNNLVRIYGANRTDITYDVPIIKITTLADLSDAYRWCTSSAEAAHFDSFALDSLTEIAEVVLATAKAGSKDPRQAYGVLIDDMMKCVRQFRDIPQKHIYMSMKMEPIKDELSGITKYGPSMPGQKLGPALPYFFDEVFRLGVNKDAQGTPYRFLQTQPDLQYDAKDRSGALAPVEYPHLGAIFQKILAA